MTQATELRELASLLRVHDGKIGIGPLTADPPYTLSLGQTNVAGAHTIRLAGSGNPKHEIQFREAGTTYGFTFRYAGDAADNKLHIVAHENDASGTEAISIKRDGGHVGIGADSPDAPLHIGGTSPHIDVGPQGGNRAKFGYHNLDVIIGSTSSTGDIIFKNNISSTDSPQTSGDQKMIISDTGVGIGISGAPSSGVMLEVEGQSSGNWISTITNTHNSNGNGLKVLAGDDADTTSFRVSTYDNTTLFDVRSDGEVTATRAYNTSHVRHSIRPSLNLDFANSKELDPRITFYRDSIATYYDSKGVLRYANTNTPRFDHDPVTGESKGLLIEEARTNIVTGATNFGIPIDFNAMYNITNTRLAPDGTMSATDVLANSGVSRHEVNIKYPGTTGTVYTASLYVKPLGAVQWLVLSRAGGTDQLGFDLINITTNNPGGTASGTISEVGNGWIKLTFSFTEATTGSTRAVYMSPGITTPTSSVYTNLNGDGLNGIALWGAQVEAGSFATSYIPSDTRFTSRSSTATYHDETGILRTAPANSPRYGYKYDGRKWVETGLILEGAATNRYTTGTGHDTISSVTGAGTVITNNYSTAPDGSNTALRFQYTSAGYGYRYWPNVHGNGNVHTHSFYIKPVSGNTHARHMIGGTPGSGSWLLNFDNQTTTQNGGNATTYGYTYEKLADGWWRVSISFSLPNSTGYVEVQWSGNNNPTEYYVWGMQVEDGLIASSFISVPSFATATRSADVFSSDAYTRETDIAKIYKFSDHFDSTELTAYVNASSSAEPKLNARYYEGAVVEGNVNDRMISYYNAEYRFLWRSKSVNDVVFSNADNWSNFNEVKQAATWKNGVANVADSTGNTQSDTSAGSENLFTVLHIGNDTTESSPICAHFRKLSFYEKALSSAELQALTENN